jgi:hypothetical protein
MFNAWNAALTQLFLDRARYGQKILFVHHSTANTFITSSPRWLMTLTAIRPDFGFGNEREVSL